MDIAKVAATVRRVAAEQPMYRLETKTDLINAADILDQLIGPDPKAASHVTAKTSVQIPEVLGVATAGPGPPKHRMTCNPEEDDRVPMSESAGVKVILKMEHSPYEF
jgi:hypothetical protein